MNTPNQDTPASPSHDTQIELAEKRMQQAEVRIDQANTRTDEANTRTDQANTRTAEANTRANEANSRTEHEVLRSIQAILASEIRYRRLFETAQDGIIILDADTGQVVDANPFMKHLLGYSQEEFLGKKLWEIGPFKGAAASKITFAELQRKDLIRYEGLPLETKDGRRVEVEFVSNGYFVDQKRLIQCNIRDMTQTKKNEARFRRLVNSNAQGVCFWNGKGEITGGNNAFLKLTGYTREDLEAGRMGWAAMTPPEYTGLDRSALGEIAAKGVCAAYEKEFIRKDGSLVPILIGAANFEDNPDEGVAFVLDLTARKKLEAEFRQSQKMEAIGQLAGGVAHDFNNILAVIQLQVGLMQAEGGLSPAQLDFVEEIGVAAQRAAGLSRQLLLFSRKETMQTRDLDLNQSINDMTKMLRRILGEDIQIQFKFAPQSLPIHADAGMINQVLINAQGRTAGY
jgi:two-component system, cell cycle sensor histidine kinase and response regulator CckA